MADITLIHGDCVVKMKDIPDNTINLTVTSPPYDNLRTYNNSSVWNEQIWKDVISELFRVTKPGGVVVWVVGDATIDGSETGTSFKQALYAKEVGFNLHDTMIYQKYNYVPNEIGRRYQPCFEYMFVFSKGRVETFNPILEEARLYGKVKPVRKNIRQADGSSKLTNGTVAGKPTKFKTNIFEYKLWRQTPHPAVFPRELAYDHVVSWSNEGDIVLDPFMGSGTVGDVCIELNRNFIGIEIDETYFKYAQSQLENKLF